MTEFKLIISDPKLGRTLQREVKDSEAAGFLGLKMGDPVKGELFGLTGYEFLITGGSDYCGFPMRRDLTGTGRKKILIVSGVGLRKTKKGMKKRKTVAGNTIHSKTAQINLKITKHGAEKLFEEKKVEEKPKEKDEAKQEMSKTKKVSEHAQKSSISDKPKPAPAKEQAKLQEKPAEKK